MQLQPVSTTYAAAPRFSSPQNQNPVFDLNNYGNKGLRPSGAPARLEATIETEFISKQTMDLEFTSKDGDRVSFSMESIQYQKSTLQIDASGSSEDLDTILGYIKDQYASMREALIKAFIEANGGTYNETDAARAIDEAQELEIPEYWNAENTSGRIVDFAVQFLGAFEGSSEEFLNMMKSAIEEGFSQARQLMGELPDKVNGLVNDTYDLVMTKLDAWALNEGIGVPEPAEAVA